MIQNCENDIAMLEENLEYYKNRYEFVQIPLNMSAVVIKDQSDYTKSSAFPNFSPDKTEEKEHSRLGVLASMVLEGNRALANKFEQQADKLFVKLGFDETPWSIMFQV